MVTQKALKKLETIYIIKPRVRPVFSKGYHLALKSQNFGAKLQLGEEG